MTENLVLEHLRAIRADIGEMKEELREHRMRLGHLEEQGGSLFGQYASISIRIDRQTELLQRVSKRLDLVE